MLILVSRFYYEYMNKFYRLYRYKCRISEYKIQEKIKIKLN